MAYPNTEYDPRLLGHDVPVISSYGVFLDSLANSGMSLADQLEIQLLAIEQLDCDLSGEPL